MWPIYAVCTVDVICKSVQGLYKSSPARLRAAAAGAAKVTRRGSCSCAQRRWSLRLTELCRFLEAAWAACVAGW